MEQRSDLIKQVAMRNLLPFLVIRIDPEEKADIETWAQQYTEKWYKHDKREHVSDSAWRIRGELAERAFAYYLAERHTHYKHAESYAYRGDTKPDFVVWQNGKRRTIGITSGRHRAMAEYDEPRIFYRNIEDSFISDYVIAVSVLTNKENGSDIAFWGVLEKPQMEVALMLQLVYKGTPDYVRIPLHYFHDEKELFFDLIYSLDREKEEAIKDARKS